MYMYIHSSSVDPYSSHPGMVRMVPGPGVPHHPNPNMYGPGHHAPGQPGMGMRPMDPIRQPNPYPPNQQ